MPKIISHEEKLMRKLELTKNVVRKVTELGCYDLYHYLMEHFTIIRNGYNCIFEKSFEERNGFYFVVEMDIDKVITVRVSVQNVFQSDSISKLGARFVIYKHKDDIKIVKDSYLYLKCDRSGFVLEFIKCLVSMHTPSPYTPVMELYKNNKKTLIIKETDYEENQ